MNAIVDGYSAGADEYAQYWGPVLEDTSRRLLDEVASVVEADEFRLLDVGAGIGSLALQARERWPRAHVIASDAAAGMLAYAGQRAIAAGADDDALLSFVIGPADELPLNSQTIDVAVSSFVLQLVPDRLAALTEIRRVLRPGGALCYVTWLDRESGEPFRAAEEFDEAVYDLEIEEPEEPEEPIAGDVRSARASTDELRKAGFVRASAREETLIYEWTMESYLEYKLNYDERALLSWLSPEQAAELERNARSRLARLAPSDFRWHAPVVFARGFSPS